MAAAQAGRSIPAGDADDAGNMRLRWGQLCLEACNAPCRPTKRNGDGQHNRRRRYVNPEHADYGECNELIGNELSTRQPGQLAPAPPAATPTQNLRLCNRGEAFGGLDLA